MIRRPNSDGMAVVTHDLGKRYGKRSALEHVDLVVPRGQVFGYLGPNGAGKTTTIRLLAGLIRPSTGWAQVLGRDTVQERDQMQRDLGYLPGDFVGYADLTGEQYLAFFAHLRGRVDAGMVAMMAKRLDLDLSRRIGTLSHGNRQEVGIIQALMHRPELVILDEPTSGLDPIVQHEFLDIVREIRDEGRTVFLSSHILSEVESIADMVGILRQGHLLAVQSVQGIKDRATRRIDLTFTSPPPVDLLPGTAGVREVTQSDHTAHVVIEGSTAVLLRTTAPYGIERIVTHEPDLEEVFLGYYEKGTAHDAENGV